MATYPYNAAFFYLCNKHGKRFLCYTAAFEKTLRRFSIKKRSEKKETATDKDKIFTYNDKNLDNTDKAIILLMTQSVSVIAKKRFSGIS